MKKIILLFFPLFFLPSFAYSQYEGSWNGIINVSGFKLPIVFHVSFEEGVCEATFDSPSQNVFGVPVNKTVCENDSIYFYMDNINAQFSGAMNEKEEKISGIFMQNGRTFPMTLHKGEYKEDKPERPQEPVAPYPYIVREIRVLNKKDNVTLSGTLTLPDSTGKFPLVILISGSGAQNRNEELMGHKPFLVIADYLTRQGMAVFRYDDRGTAQSTGNFAEATSLDFSYDAEACMQQLSRHPNIDAKKIGFAGHSEGGLIAPMIAARNKKTAFIILLAGPGVNGKDIIVKQTEIISAAEGETDGKESAAASAKLIDALIANRDPKKAEAVMRKLFHEELKKLSAEELKEIPDTSVYITMNIARMNNHWFRYFVAHDPAPDLQKVKCPVLAMNGDKDLQVDAEQNLPPIEACLKKAKNKHFRIEKMSGYNHLFQHTTTGKISEYGENTETFAPEALEIMSKWLREESVLKP